MTEKLNELVAYYRERAEIAGGMVDDSLKDGNNVQANIIFGYKKGITEICDELEKIVQEFSGKDN